MKIRGAVLERIADPAPFADSQPITVCELELGRTGTGELLVRIEAAGVCHSDLSVVDGNRVRPVPMLLGHEAAGIVEDVGARRRRFRRRRPGRHDVPAALRRVRGVRARGGAHACAPGTAANTAGTLLGGGRRLHRDGRPVHHHLGVSGFATHAVVDRRSVVAVGRRRAARRRGGARVRGAHRRWRGRSTRAPGAGRGRHGRRPRRRGHGGAAHRGRRSGTGR